MKKRKLLYLFPLAALLLSGCELPDFLKKKNTEPEQQQSQEEQPGGEQGGETPVVKKDFEGLSLNDATFTYDGQAHSISVEGELPQGASVDYGQAGNQFTDAGEHAVTAVVSCEGYNSLTLTGTLTITKADMQGVTFVGTTVTYDGQEHKLEVSGLPEGASVSYGQTGNTFTNAGEYEITATVTCANYNDLTLRATLTIEKANFVGIVFENATVTYDGQPHTLTPTVPEIYAGAQINYVGDHEFTATGTYEITAKVTLANYNDWSDHAYLTIVDAHFAGLSLPNTTVTYNGQKQTIELVGELPQGATATYVEGYDGGTLPGEYTIKMDIAAEGYETVQLTATLTIEKATFEGIVFNDTEFVYDGEPHQIVPSVPAQYEGAEIAYSEGGNSLTEVGSLEVTATVTLTGYNDWSKTVTLTIAKANIQGVTFEARTVPYDGLFHTIEPADLPAGTTFTYDEGHEGGTEPGDYIVSGKVTGANYNDLELSAKLTISYEAANEALMIEDFENLSDSDLASQPYSFERYYTDPDTHQDGWGSNLGGAKFAIAHNQAFGDGENTLKMDIFHHGLDWRINKKVAPKKQYSGFSLDTFVDDYDTINTEGPVKIIIRFAYSNLPFPDSIPNPVNPSYPDESLEWAKGEDGFELTWQLESNAPTNWTHWEVPFDDASLVVHHNAYNQYGLDTRQLFETLMGQCNMTYENMSRFLTTVSVDVKPSATANNDSVKVYIDNFKLLADAPANKTMEEQVNFENRVYTIKSSDDTVFKLTLGGDVSKSAVFESINLENNASLEGTYSVAGKALTLNVSPDGGTNNVAFHLKAINNGQLLKFDGDNPTGDVACLAPYAAHTSFSSNFEEYVNIEDFESYSATGVGYDRHHTIEQATGLRAAYYAEVYNENHPAPGLITDNWNLMNDTGWTTYTNLENGGQSGKCMSLYGDSSWPTRVMPFAAAQQHVGSYGRGSVFSFYAKASAARTITVRVFYEDQITSTNHALQYSGSELVYQTGVAVSDEWSRIEIPLNPKKNIYAFSINLNNSSARLYVDQFELFGSASPYDVYVAPIPELVNDGLFALTFGGNLITLDLSNDVTSAVVSQNGEAIGTFNAVMTDGSLVLTHALGGAAAFQIEFTILNNELTVASVSGSYAPAAYQAMVGKKFTETAHANLNYNVENSNYTNNWSHEKWGTDDWVSAGTQMWYKTSSSGNGNHFASIYAGKKNLMKYTTKPASVQCGIANHFEIDLINDYTNSTYTTCGPKNIKIILINSDNSSTYLVGDASNFGVLPANAGRKATNSNETDNWIHLQFDFADTYVKSICLVAKNERDGDDYMYFDNIKLTYETQVQRTLTCTNDWDITASNAELYGWVWNGNGDGHWIALSVEGSTGSQTINIRVPSSMTGMKILRCDPASAYKPMVGTNIYQNIFDSSAWNVTGDITFANSLNFSF